MFSFPATYGFVLLAAMFVPDALFAICVGLALLVEWLVGAEG